MKFAIEFPFDLVLLELPFFIGEARQEDFISGAPEIMPSWGLKYYPFVGLIVGKRHVRKHGFGKADNLGFKVPKIQETGVGLAISPLLSLFLFLCFLRGWRVLVFNPGAFIILYGPPICLYDTCMALPRSPWPDGPSLRPGRGAAAAPGASRRACQPRPERALDAVGIVEPLETDSV